MASDTRDAPPAFGSPSTRHAAALNRVSADSSASAGPIPFFLVSASISSTNRFDGCTSERMTTARPPCWTASANSKLSSASNLRLKEGASTKVLPNALAAGALAVDSLCFFLLALSLFLVCVGGPAAQRYRFLRRHDAIFKSQCRSHCDDIGAR